MSDITANSETGSDYAIAALGGAHHSPVGRAAALWGLHTLSTLAGRFLTHRALLAVTGGFLLAAISLAIIVARPLPFAEGITFALALGACLTAMGAGVFAYRLGHVLTYRRPETAARIAEGMLFSPRWTNALPALLSLAVLVAVMNAVAAALPELNSHVDEANLIALDRAVHLGVLPSEITHALAGFFDLLYRASLVWVLVFYVAIAFARKDTPHRQQFLVALSLTWASGALVMVLAASAGSAFSAGIPGSGPYADLFTRLAAIDAETSLWSLGLQHARLETLSIAGAGAHFAAVAAMPSLVSASVTVVALAAFRIHAWLGFAASAMAVLSGIAALHLGWNYAVDCCAGAVLAFVAWKAVGWVMARAH